MTCQANLGQIQVAIKIQIPEYCGSASEKNCLFISVGRILDIFTELPFHWIQLQITKI